MAGPRPAARHGEGHRDSSRAARPPTAASCRDGSAARVVREGLLPRPRRVGLGDRQGDQERVPEAVPRSTTRTPTRATRRPRSASRRCRRPTTSSATPSAARSTTRCADSGRPRPGSRAAAAGPGGFQFQDAGDLGDLLGGLFGRSAPWRRRGGRGPHRGQDLETELHLTFDDAVAGRRPRPSTSRATRRATPATAPAPSRARCPHRCSSCGGQGVVSDNQGLFSFSSPCPVCGGRGDHDRRPVPHVSRHRRGAPAPRGQGPGAGRRRRRPAHPAEGTRAGRARTVGRPATSSWSSASRRTRSSSGEGVTSPSPSRSPSPRRPSAPTSPSPPLDGGSVRLRIPAGHAVRAHLPGQGQGRGHPEGHRGSAGHRRGGSTVQAVERRAQGARGLPSRIGRGIAPRAPGGVMDIGARASSHAELSGSASGRAEER